MIYIKDEREKKTNTDDLVKVIFFLDWLVAASSKEDVQSVPPLDGLMTLERKPF